MDRGTGFSSRAQERTHGVGRARSQAMIDLRSLKGPLQNQLDKLDLTEEEKDRIVTELIVLGDKKRICQL